MHILSIFVVILVTSFAIGVIHDCCLQREHGGKTYFLHEIDETNETMTIHGCQDNCVYVEDGGNTRTCFRYGGTEKPTCGRDLEAFPTCGNSTIVKRTCNLQFPNFPTNPTKKECQEVYDFKSTSKKYCCSCPAMNKCSGCKTFP